MGAWAPSLLASFADREWGSVETVDFFVGNFVPMAFGFAELVWECIMGLLEFACYFRAVQARFGDDEPSGVGWSSGSASADGVGVGVGHSSQWCTAAQELRDGGTERVSADVQGTAGEEGCAARHRLRSGDEQVARGETGLPTGTGADLRRQERDLRTERGESVDSDRHRRTHQFGRFLLIATYVPC